MTRPPVVLTGLLRGVDEVTDHPDAPRFTDHQAGVVTETVPCARADCDGRGWIQLDENTVAKCLRCPDTVRRADHDEDAAQLGLQDEPSF